MTQASEYQLEQQYDLVLACACLHNINVGKNGYYDIIFDESLAMAEQYRATNTEDPPPPPEPEYPIHADLAGTTQMIFSYLHSILFIIIIHALILARLIVFIISSCFYFYHSLGHLFLLITLVLIFILLSLILAW
ncbi:hypothetical protein PSTT_09943 [Puccinia striiformis]|uniref:DDE Tnp4 domain-containing protein n=1 Tax=Puccinia striiformis TaxID=27350 RepID=A0A2S4V6J8_9BASI|nr:hypothetical protein PSTT_09943 [Puccinia striiformis]